MELKVIKRDGSLEPFLPEKIIRVLKAAGLEPEAAEALTNKILVWAEQQPVPKINTLLIKDRVIEELKKVNEAAANLFTWYEHTKEKNGIDY